MRSFVKLSAVAVAAAFILTLMPMTASAAPLRVAYTKALPKGSATATSRVVFRAKLNKSAKVRVTVYKGSRKIRSMSVSRRAAVHSVGWNLRNSSGTTVTAGSYWYKVSPATTTRGSRSGRVRVKNPAPSPEPTSTPTPTPTPTPAPNPSEPSGRWVGFYQTGVPTDMSKLTDLESKVGRKAKVVNFFVSDAEGGFPTSRVQRIADHGSIPLLTLELWSTQSGGVGAITNGSRDAYWRAFAQQAAAYGGEVWVRPLHEMNGNWYPWSGTTNGNTPAKVVEAWRRIHGILEANGATNVKLVWCPNAESVPNTSANQIEKFWPGSSYVDYVAIDGYNFGTYASWSSWRSFSNVMGSAYSKITALTTRPMFIAETGSVEQGGSKADWMRGMFTKIPTYYPRIQGVVYFNGHGGENWAVESSTSSLNAFKAEVADGF
ncbi:MAG: hypothetical protein HY876_00365 [Coriobacteriales bacterium]|nr:hypothetical protein [Coriobacteriales bacterium]